MTTADHPSGLARPFVRELVASTLLYLVATAALRWAPLPFALPTRFNASAILITLGSMALFGTLAHGLLRRWAKGQRLAAAGAITLPILLGDAIATANFALVYPRFDPASAGVFAAMLLFTNFAVLAAGWAAERAP